MASDLMDKITCLVCGYTQICHPPRVRPQCHECRSANVKEQLIQKKIREDHG